ncbi:hypothetical protein GGF44_002377 [Coemansia sp. RSA 1694]|nr:hypothetical protein GGF38_000965 [Coemansia sp. RSA 25]KAJ2640878.1 hypothetical protein GGF44_002377 [Coemansia sp. RSA 1694]
MQIIKLAVSLVAVAATGAVAAPADGRPTMVRIGHAAVPTIVRIGHDGAPTIVRIGHDERPTVIRIGHDGESSSSAESSSPSSPGSDSPSSAASSTSVPPSSTSSSTSTSATSNTNTSTSSSTKPSGDIGKPTNISKDGTSTEFVDGNTTVISSTESPDSSSKSNAADGRGFASVVTLALAGSVSVLLAAF